MAFLHESMEKRSRRISAMSLEQCDIKNQLSFSINCSVQPRPFAVDFDSGLVDRDPLRLRRRRVRNAVRSCSQYSSHSMSEHPLDQSANCMLIKFFDLLIPQTGLTKRCLGICFFRSDLELSIFSGKFRIITRYLTYRESF